MIALSIGCIIYAITNAGFLTPFMSNQFGHCKTLDDSLPEDVKSALLAFVGIANLLLPTVLVALMNFTILLKLKNRTKSDRFVFL